MIFLSFSEIFHICNTKVLIFLLILVRVKVLGVLFEDVTGELTCNQFFVRRAAESNTQRDEKRREDYGKAI